MTVEAILEAAARILEADGMSALNTNLVAQTAGVSVGSLYQYFPSKEAIVAELIRQMRAEMLLDLETAAAQLADLPLAEQVEPLIRASVAHHQRRPVLAVALEGLETDLPMQQEIDALKGRIATLLVELLTRHKVTDPATAAFDLAAMTSGMANAAARGGVTDFEPVVRRITRAAQGYLGI